MKKFISVILAIMMVVAVMPFAIFAADEYVRPANKAHACHPVNADGSLALTDLDMTKLYKDGAFTITFKDGKAYNVAEFLVDGKNNTATRLTKGSTTITVETAGKTLINFATLKLVVNGTGTINPTYVTEANGDPIYKIAGYEQVIDYSSPKYILLGYEQVDDLDKPIMVQATDEETGDPLYEWGWLNLGDGAEYLPIWPIMVQDTDEDGNLLYEQKDDESKPIYKQLVIDGKEMFDKDGNPVYEQLVIDGVAQWNTKDDTTKPIYEQATDEDGNLIYEDTKKVTVEVEVQKVVDGKPVFEKKTVVEYKEYKVDDKVQYAQKWDAEEEKFVDDTTRPLYIAEEKEVDDETKPVMVTEEKEIDVYDEESDPVYVIEGYEKVKTEHTFEGAGEVKVASKHNLKVNVVVYGLDKDGKDVVVYTSDKDIDTTNLTELVLDVFEPGYKVVVTTVGTAEEGKAGPRIWEIDATTFETDVTKMTNHTWVNTITKYPSLEADGAYTRKCSVCGYADPAEQKIDKLAYADLTAGKLTADDVEFTEVLKLVDEKGNPLKDDDGNEIPITSPTQADPANLFDGNKNSGGLWNANGSYWTASQEGSLTIKFKEPKIVSYLYITVTFNAWPGISFEFYNGDTLVAKTTGNWKNDQTPDDRWTNTWENKTLDFGTDYGLNGKTIDKIYIKFNNQVSDNYRKISEIEVGCHTHVYDDSLVTKELLDAKKVVRTEGKTCEYTFTNAADVVCRECGAAAKGDKDGKVTMTLHNYPETVVDGKVVLDESKAKVTAATCGKDGKLEYTCSHEYVDESKPVYERYTKKVDGKDVPVYGKNNQQLYLGIDGKGYDGTEITDWSKIKIKEYSKTTCGDKLVVDIPATNAHKGTTTTVRIGKYPNCGATGTAYVICTDCKQRVEIATAADLVKYGLASDANALKGTNLDKSFTDEATGKAYTVRFAVDGNGKVTSIVALTTGYHRTAYKNVVASTYTAHGIDCAYCTVCGTTFAENTKDAELLVPVAKLRTLGFSLRTAEFEGLRGTFTLNNEVIKGMQANGYNVRIWVVVTNAAGVSKEIQIYGAGSNAWVALDGKFSVVVKGGSADEVYTFSYKIVVEDDYGTAENVVELGKSSVAEVKAAQ